MTHSIECHVCFTSGILTLQYSASVDARIPHFARRTEPADAIDFYSLQNTQRIENHLLVLLAMAALVGARAGAAS